MKALDKSKKKQKHRLRIVAVCLVVIIALVTISGIYLINHKTPSSSPKAQMQALVNKVGRLMQLPTNEQPTVATVTDQAQLSQQPFFDNAKNGDKVLLYTKNKLAILYSPSENKIINVGPINGSLSYDKFSVSISNGTKNSQYTNDVVTQLNASFPEAKVAEKSSASQTYPDTIVIPVNSSDDNIAAMIANVIGGKIGIVPIGETTPNTDILIIIGQNYSD